MNHIKHFYTKGDYKMGKNIKPIKMLALGLCASTMLFACSSKETLGQSSTTETNSLLTSKEISKLVSENVTYSKTDLNQSWNKDKATKIQLKGKTAAVSGTGKKNVSIQKNIVTIKAGGTYVISGKLSDGQLQIAAADKDKVRIILNGAEIHSSDRTAIYVKNADKVVLSLPKGKQNKVSDGKAYATTGTDEPNAAIYSKDDLTINGDGKLIVQGNFNNGVTSKDDLKITGGEIQIQSKDDGLMGRDSVAVKNGKLTIKAGGDAIKSTNDQDSSKGFVALQGGTYRLTAASDGIQAETSLWTTAGTYTIKAGGGSPDVIENKEMRPGEQEPAKTASTNTKTGKGLKAGKQLAIGGGTFSVDASDDAFHSNDQVTVAGGTLKISTGDDGIHADNKLEINGGNTIIKKSYEGIEAKDIYLAKGKLSVTASDDGINAGGSSDTETKTAVKQEESKAKQPDQPGENTGKSDGKLVISGGNFYIDAQGDGLDSNGSISMSGGTVIVNGPTNNGNGALDYDSDFTIDGGVLIAAGSSGMAQATSDESQQSTIQMTFPQTQKAGTLIHLQDSDGKELLSFAPAKEYQSVVISTPDLKKDKTYELYTGGKHTGKEDNGLYSDGKYSGGKQIVTFKITDTVTYLDESGITSKPAGGPGMGGAPGAGGGPGQHEGGPGNMFEGIDDATKEKVQAIMEKERAGTITREEAQIALKELGIEMPERPSEQGQK